MKRYANCPKDGEPVKLMLVADGHGLPRQYCDKFHGKTRCGKDERRRICEFDMKTELWKSV